jgi:hypothetical protein
MAEKKCPLPPNGISTNGGCATGAAVLGTVAGVA